MMGSIVILLVEDEAFIQDLVELALQDGGFAVAKASSGEEAMAMLEADETGFHALVSDINLGHGPTGWAWRSGHVSLTSICRSST